MHGESEFFLNIATREQLYRLLCPDQFGCAESVDIVGTCGKLFFQITDIDYFVLLPIWILETTQFWLAANEWRLTTFKSGMPFGTAAGILTFDTATSSGTAFAAISPSNTLAGWSGTFGWLESVKHDKSREKPNRYRTVVARIIVV